MTSKRERERNNFTSISTVLSFSITSKSARRRQAEITTQTTSTVIEKTIEIEIVEAMGSPFGDIIREIPVKFSLPTIKFDEKKIIIKMHNEVLTI